MQRNESIIQRDIVQYLQSQRIFCHSVPNEAQGRSVITQGQLVAMGLRSGVADLVVWIPKDKGVEIAYFEVKDEKGQQSERQKTFERICHEHEVPYYLVRSVEDVQKVLDKT